MEAIRNEQEVLLSADQQSQLVGLLSDAELNPDSIGRMEAAVAKLPLQPWLRQAASEGKDDSDGDLDDGSVMRGAWSAPARCRHRDAVSWPVSSFLSCRPE
jgi:hypothetical protein